MVYSEQTWNAGRVGNTPVNVARLQHMEDGIAAAAVTADVSNPATPTGAALRAALVPFWTAAEAVTTGTVRIDATGHLITANSNRTTRGSYDATEQAAWTVVISGITSTDAAGTALVISLIGI